MIKFTETEKKFITSYIKVYNKAREMEYRFMTLLEKKGLTGDEYACSLISNCEVETADDFEALLEEFKGMC